MSVEYSTCISVVGVQVYIAVITTSQAVQLAVVPRISHLVSFCSGSPSKEELFGWKLEADSSSDGNLSL